MKLQTPPSFCQFVSGACDKTFAGTPESYAFFAYPSLPAEIAATISDTVQRLNGYTKRKEYSHWQDLQVAGRLVLCEICKAIRHTRMLVADVTTLNFNVMFEIGLALGLGVPILPIRDASYPDDHRLLSQLGFFDTLGWERYENAATLQAVVTRNKDRAPEVLQVVAVDRDSPVFLVRSPHDSENSTRLQSALRKAAYDYREFDVREVSRLSVFDALRQVHRSLGVICHLLAPAKTGADLHNARCALIAGIAVALERHVLMLADDTFEQPIDYRDIVRVATSGRAIEASVEVFKEKVTAAWDTMAQQQVTPLGRLSDIDLGEPAAENESARLAEYFIQTSEFSEVRHGNATLVVGRKGTGKTAIFLRMLDDLTPGVGRVVVDFRPQPHQIAKMREAIEGAMSRGLRDHALVAAWKYLIMQEVAIVLQRDDEVAAYESQLRARAFERLKQASRLEREELEQDFAERLHGFLHRWESEVAEHLGRAATAGELTSWIYRGDYREFESALEGYLEFREETWVLIDNLDKGWVAGRPETTDIAVIRALVEAAGQLRVRLQSDRHEFHPVVFLRQDVHAHLVAQTSDRGKESTVAIDWSDDEQLKELLLGRIQRSLPGDGDFAAVWSRIAVPHVGGMDSFAYIIGHTLRRPRDLLNLMRKALHVAVNRSHSRIEEDDFQRADSLFSEDLLSELVQEMSASGSTGERALVALTELGDRFAEEDALLALELNAGLASEQAADMLQRLLWFGFIGYAAADRDADGLYAYDTRYDVLRLEARARSLGYLRNTFVVHPGFHQALFGERGP